MREMSDHVPRFGQTTPPYVASERMPEQYHGHAKPLGMSNQIPPGYLPLPEPQEQEAH